MSLPDPEMQPDLEDVLQVEEPAGSETAVKVEQQGPTRSQTLPRKGGATFTRTIGSSAPTRLLGADPRRFSALINAADDIWVAFTKSGVVAAIENADQNGAYRVFGSTVPFPVGAVVEVWACAVTTTARVSIATELWATGEASA